jgi:hypothetical protein
MLFLLNGHKNPSATSVSRRLPGHRFAESSLQSIAQDVDGRYLLIEQDKTKFLEEIVRSQNGAAISTTIFLMTGWRVPSLELHL